MRRILFAALTVIFAASLAVPVVAQGAPPQGGADQPYTMEYYYKVQWGHQQEFLELFLRNHYPLLKRVAASGRILSIKIESPAYHTTEDGRWDYRVTIRYKNSTVATTWARLTVAMVAPGTGIPRKCFDRQARSAPSERS